MATIGEMIDRMALLDREVDKHQASVKKLNEQRSLLERKLMKEFDKQGISKASGKLVHAMTASRRNPSIKDLKKFTSYVMKHQAFDLYQRRINSKAYFDRLEQGDAVPGIDVFEKHFIRLVPKRN